MPPRRRSVLASKIVVDRPGVAQPAIADELRRVILNGDIPPGAPIPLGDVAELFGVSHIPVRESLKTLQGEGLVAHRSHVGYTVAQLTADELREMYVVRETLESAALAVALDNASADERQHAATANAQLRAAIEIDDPVAFHRHSRQFHVALVKPSRMLRLLHMLEAAWNVTEPVQPMVHVARADRAHLQADHDQMLEAFVAGNSARLLAAAATHHRRLNSVIDTLPADIGLLAPEDISFGK